MKAQVPLFAGLALSVSVGLHLAGFAMQPSQAVQIEGGAPMQAAMLGNSFADMVEGSVDSTPQKAVTEPVEQIDQTEPVETPEPTEPEQPVTKPAPAPLPQPSLTAPTIAESRTNPVVALIETPVPTAHRPVINPPVVSVTQPPETAPLTRPTVVQPAKAPKVLAALAPPPPHQTLRAKAPVERREVQPDTVRPVARPQKPAKPKRAPAPATRKGSDQDRKKGQADGQEAGQAAASSPQRSATASAAGNAAVANYPGLVMRKVRNTRKERAGIKGKAIVGFKISASGAISWAGILQSSGSAKIDAIALRHIHRASPFAPPPKGARRNFRIEFVPRR